MSIQLIQIQTQGRFPLHGGWLAARDPHTLLKQSHALNLTTLPQKGPGGDHAILTLGLE